MRIKDIKAEIKRLEYKFSGNVYEDKKVIDQIMQLRLLINKTDGEEKDNKKTND